MFCHGARRGGIFCAQPAVPFSESIICSKLWNSHLLFLFRCNYYLDNFSDFYLFNQVAIFGPACLPSAILYAISKMLLKVVMYSVNCRRLEHVMMMMKIMIIRSMYNLDR